LNVGSAEIYHTKQQRTKSVRREHVVCAELANRCASWHTHNLCQVREHTEVLKQFVEVEAEKIAGNQAV